MKVKIIIILLVIISLASTSIVGAVTFSKNLNDEVDLKNSGKFLDIAVADIAPYKGVRTIFSDSNGEYTSCQNHKAGGDPEKVISQDFNKDGLDDLAVIDYISGDLCILLQKDSGGFDLNENRRYYSGVGPKNLISGHFNSDNYFDIAVITMGGEFVDQYQLTIFLGKSNGEFNKHKSYNLNKMPHDLTIGDFNNDGAFDIAVISNSILIYLNKNIGTGDFEYHASLSTDGWRITSGDFNNDGLWDLATTNPDKLTVSVYLGNATETDFFEDDSQYPIGGSVPSGLTTGYFDGDGYLDIAVANGAYSQSVSILLSESGTGFRPYVTYSTGYNFPCNIISGDVNKDGKTDLVVVSISDTQSGGVSILFGNSEGSFSRTSLNSFKGSYWGVAIGEFGDFYNQNPSKPEILGPVNGASGIIHEYTFSADDPEDDFIRFEINWGDGSEIKETLLCNGNTKESHSWNEDGGYTIRARTIDHNGGVSDWESMEIKMPKISYNQFKNWIKSLIIGSCPKLLTLLQ